MSETLLAAAAAVGLGLLGVLGKRAASRRPSSERPDRRQSSDPAPRDAGSRRRYPGDFEGTVRASYAASLDGRPDPGEVVWSWVPYEDDHSQGKDRPVLLVGRDGKWLLGLMLTSKDHDRDAADEARHGRRWLDIGTGDWDRQRRPSEVRLDRVIRLHPDDVRREGAVLSRTLFDEIVGYL